MCICGCDMCSCLLWLKYGLLVGDKTTISVNGLGLCLSAYAVLIYYYHAEKKHNVLRSIMGLLGGVYAYLLCLKMGWISYGTLGPSACLVSLIMMASPLISILLHALGLLLTSYTSQSPFRWDSLGASLSTISTALATIGFLGSVSWTLYGRALQDDYIFYPNLYSSIISLIQVVLSLFAPAMAPIPASDRPQETYPLKPLA